MVIPSLESSLNEDPNNWILPLSQIQKWFLNVIIVGLILIHNIENSTQWQVLATRILYQENPRGSFGKALCKIVFVCSVASDFVTPWTAAHQASLSVGFPRQEYWSGLPFSSPGALPDPGMEPTSLGSLALAGGFFTAAPQSCGVKIFRRFSVSLAWHVSLWCCLRQWDRIDGIFTDHLPSDSLPLFFCVIAGPSISSSLISSLQ